MKKCDLCHQDIHEATDKYTHVEDWTCGKKLSDMWVHYECFKRAMNKDLKQMQETAKKIIIKAGGILNNMLPAQQDTFTL